MLQSQEQLDKENELENFLSGTSDPSDVIVPLRQEVKITPPEITN